MDDLKKRIESGEANAHLRGEAEALYNSTPQAPRVYEDDGTLFFQRGHIVIYDYIGQDVRITKAIEKAFKIQASEAMERIYTAWGLSDTTPESIQRPQAHKAQSKAVLLDVLARLADATGVNLLTGNAWDYNIRSDSDGLTVEVPGRFRLDFQTGKYSLDGFQEREALRIQTSTLDDLAQAYKKRLSEKTRRRALSINKAN